MDTKDFITDFDSYLGNSLNPLTKSLYLDVAERLLNNTLSIKSRSRYNQVLSVVKKIEASGLLDDSIKININRKWSKREGSRIQKIQNKLITDDQFQQVLSALPKTEKGKELHLACQIAWYSGLRLHEVLSLTDKHIELNEHICLSITGKNGKFRKTYLPRKMSAELLRFTDFTIGYEYIRRTLYRVSKDIEVDVSFHSLRHNFATNLIKSGVKLPKVQRLLGHADMQTTAIYLHFDDELDEDLKSIGY